MTVYYADDPSRLRKYEPGLRYRRWTIVSAFQSLKCSHKAWRAIAHSPVGLDRIRAARDVANMNPDVVTYAEYEEAFTELVESEHARAIIEGGIA